MDSGQRCAKLIGADRLHKKLRVTLLMSSTGHPSTACTVSGGGTPPTVPKEIRSFARRPPPPPHPILILAGADDDALGRAVARAANQRPRGARPRRRRLGVECGGLRPGLPPADEGRRASRTWRKRWHSPTLLPPAVEGIPPRRRAAPPLPPPIPILVPLPPLPTPPLRRPSSPWFSAWAADRGGGGPRPPSRRA